MSQSYHARDPPISMLMHVIHEEQLQLLESLPWLVRLKLIGHWLIGEKVSLLITPQ